ncbi:MAG: RNA polymerase sigma factor [Proteobacteria bacterium]|nr:RNA polymerase sigma factor [Pseudomonadota bacterium]
MANYPDDKRLVKQLLAKDEQAFDRFFKENFARLYRFAMTRLPDDPEGTREVVQIALSRAIAKLHTYRGESALFTWLCAITRNEMSDWLARQGRYRQVIVLTDDYPEIQAAVDSFQAPRSDDPEQNYQRAELVRLIQVALDQLPPKYGNVLEWKYIEGYSVSEIAGKLDLGTEATQSLLARAKRAFSDVYGSLTGPARSAMTGMIV